MLMRALPSRSCVLGCSFRITMYKCIYSSLDFNKLPFYPKNFRENQELV